MTLSNTLRYLEEGGIELIETQVGDPKDDEVQLHGGACGICSWDIGTVKLGKKMPMAPAGHEGIGYVAKVGRAVSTLKEGDRVVGGGFATLRNLPATSVYKIPESSLPDEHWVVEPVSCAVTGLDHCRIKAGDRVAVVGTGFMGLLILQGLAHSPLDQLVAMDIAQDRLNLAKKLGAHEAYNLAQVDKAELVNTLRQRGFDCVVDTTGTQGGLDMATSVVKPGGLVNLFGWLKGAAATFDPTQWHVNGFTVVNSSPSAKLRDPFPPAIRLIHRGIFDLRPLVTHTTTLSEYPALMDKIVHGDKTYVKGVVRL